MKELEVWHSMINRPVKFRLFGTKILTSLLSFHKFSDSLMALCLILQIEMKVWPSTLQCLGVWEYTEELTRELAKLYGTIYVISGSIFDVDNDGIEDSVHEPKR